MSEQTDSALKQLWKSLFGHSWPVYIGGIILATLNILLFIVYKPWGGTGTYISWGQNFYKIFGMYKDSPGIFGHMYGLLGVVTVLGAFVAALFSKEFAIRIPPIGELFKGFLGGILMAIGCTIGLGCTVGGFLSGWPAMSAGGVILVLGFVLGTWIALKYLLWEMEHLPKMSMGKSFNWLSSKKKSKLQPIIGWIVTLAVLIGGSIIYKEKYAFTWFLILGFIIGLVLQKSRFCIVRAFREPFMTGESEAPIGVMAAIIVTLLGFTVIKYMGVGASTLGGARILAMTWVSANFWLNALIGGTIFGFGMTIAGGCAVGCLWRVGEGQVKLWMAAIGFLLMAPISQQYIAAPFLRILPESTQKAIFLPDVIGYAGGVLLIAFIILLWYIFVKWNERTGKFTAL
ncbi:MAG: YeeE/YedE thiosulfate transporter family protein [Candidatus Zixiibacteriota bacterium]